MNPLDELDMFDKKIIEILQKKPDTSYSDLSKTINKSQPTIGARILKLSRSGFSNICYGINFRSSHLPLFSAELESNDPDKINQRANNCPFVLNVFNRSGQMNINLLMTATTQEKFNEIVDPCLRRDKSIQHINIVPIIKIKEDLIIPLNFQIEFYEKLICSNDCPFKEKKNHPFTLDKPISIAEQFDFYPDIKNYFNKMIDSMKKWLLCEGIALFFMNKSKKMTYYASIGLNEAFFKNEDTFLYNEQIANFIVTQNTKTLVSENGSIRLNIDDNMDEIPLEMRSIIREQCNKEGIKKMGIIPIKINSIIIGFVFICGNDEEFYSESNLVKIESSTNLIGNAIENIISRI